MAISLEQYIAEATNAYKPAQTAIQNQLGSLDSNLATAQNTINRNYEQQQKQLEAQRNQAAEASSMAAAGSGGTFGGQGNLARRKYYEQSFVPAQTQLQGPELVGSIGGHTAVATNDDIVASVSSGVYQAVSSAMGGRDKNISVHVYLDSREIKSGQQRLARATGG